MNTSVASNYWCDPDWCAANQHYLSAALDQVRAALECYVAKLENKSVSENQDNGQQALAKIGATMPAPPAIDRLTAMFNLSNFERDLLLLCAGVEMDANFALLCAAARGDSHHTYATFSLALAALPNSHWDAIAPVSPLRRWRLLEVGAGSALTLSPLRIDERILHYLAGTQYLDERLMGIIEPLPRSGETLVASHQVLAEKVAAIWSGKSVASVLPIVQLCGADKTSQQAIAALACNFLGLKLHWITSAVVPLVPSDLENVVRVWSREYALSASVLLLDCDQTSVVDAARASAITRFIERIHSPLIITSREQLRILNCPVISFDVHQPTSEEQKAVWQESLADIAPQLNNEVQALVAQFNLSSAAIRTACAKVTEQLDRDSSISSTHYLNLLWNTCRIQSRPRLDELAQRIEPIADWESLVLPEAQAQILHEVAAHVRQRARVYQDWGFANKGTRGLGISALFAGASGTGKTLAAEVLANELRLDLYRIDLSSVVSKYIGETEKNLRQVFDAAEAGGVILLFDEADALFGKRSEVKDARDRYANIEVSYLLQRMECYPGLAILTTNLKSALDTAFLRRIRFVVQFPFPDATQRAEIWRRIFPGNTPTEGLDSLKLAQLNIAGGNIRNIALNAAFLAAEAEQPIQMKHLLRAAKTEYTKLEKPLTEIEISGWT